MTLSKKVSFIRSFVLYFLRLTLKLSFLSREEYCLIILMEDVSAKLMVALSKEASFIWSFAVMFDS